MAGPATTDEAAQDRYLFRRRVRLGVAVVMTVVAAGAGVVTQDAGTLVSVALMWLATGAGLVLEASKDGP